MKLVVLADNNTYIDQYYLAEPALSIYIENGEKKYLFDTGYSDVYLKNAAKLGIELESLDAVIISHGHNDHTGGLAFYPKLQKKPLLVAHLGIMESKRAEGLSISLPVSESYLQERFTFKLIREPLWLDEQLVFLGEIPRMTLKIKILWESIAWRMAGTMIMCWMIRHWSTSRRTGFT